MTKKTKDYYLALPYIIEVTPIKPEDGGGYSACIPMLGRYTCVGDGETYEEAIRDLKINQASLIDRMLSEGNEIPEPIEQRTAIKTFLLRLPADLYGQIMETAKKEGVSINRYIRDILAKYQNDFELERAFETIRAEIQYMHHDLIRTMFESQPRGTSPSTDTSLIIDMFSLLQYWLSKLPRNPQPSDLWTSLIWKPQAEQESGVQA